MQLHGDQIKDETITGSQIKDDSVDSSDIKDESITLDDFEPSLKHKFEILDLNVRNTLLNSLEIKALKGESLNQGFSAFIDSFNDNTLLDPESTNYGLNVTEGYIGLVEGVNYILTDTTQNQFSQGTHNQTEAYLDSGGDGAVRKAKSIVGNTLTLEDFEDISNVKVFDPTERACEQSGIAGTVYSGSYSGLLTVDFSGASDTETLELQVLFDFGGAGIDLSSYSILRLHYLKQEAGVVNYAIEIEDTSSNTYLYPQESLNSGYVYQTIEKDLTQSFPSIDETAIKYIRFITYESATDQIILNVPTVATNEREIADSSELIQTFKVTETTECQRITLKVRYNASTPTDALYVAVTDIFGSPLGFGFIPASDAPATLTDKQIVLDRKFTLSAGILYGIKIISPLSSGNQSWYVSVTSPGEKYSDGVLTYNGSTLNRSLTFTLRKPAVIEPIYLDQLEAEAVSTYYETGYFISRKMNLGIVPNSLDLLSWIPQILGDTIQVRLKFASTSAGLDGIGWSSAFTDSSGVTNNLSGVSPNQWFQYRIDWVNGNTSNSSVVKEINLEYSVNAGTGSATIVSALQNTNGVPDSFVFVTENQVGTGAILYYISRDNKETWQLIDQSEIGDQIAFTSGSGSQLHLKAVITGGARLYGWAVMVDAEML